jgi:hypothetical protein
MEREILVREMVRNIKQLPTTRIREVNDFVEFMLQKANDALITEGLQQLSSSSSVYDFLDDEPDIYSINDLKVKYK